ncbi:MAG TPA: hypothetical protein VM715_21125 [Candidatus Acidoferrum sp.]|nr:hypothetical protein [Candidatus Acidoferrum sp.]
MSPLPHRGLPDAADGLVLIAVPRTETLLRVRVIDKSTTLMPALIEPPSDRQRAFLRYYTGTLIDLVILGLFNEFSDKVWVSSFSIALLAAILLQFLLKLTLAVEHRVASYFKAKPGTAMRLMRFFGAWLILFGSKFVILEALALAFGKEVRFEGALHGIVWLIIVVVVMVVAEELVVRLYRRLA